MDLHNKLESERLSLSRAELYGLSWLDLKWLAEESMDLTGRFLD